MAALPEKPPAIDWAYYKATVAKAGLVDDFEKKVTKALVLCCGHRWAAGRWGNYTGRMTGKKDGLNTQIPKAAQEGWVWPEVS